MSLEQWIKDFRWAMNAMRARRFRRGLLFSQRAAFDRALRPLFRGEGLVVEYPDAFYLTSIDDLCRATAFAVVLHNTNTGDS